MTAGATPTEEFTGATHVVLDIEGTTTSISFVYESLFPYAAEALAGFLEDSWEDDAVQGDVALVQAQAEADRAAGEDAPEVPAPGAASEEARRAAVLANLRWLMASDRKATGLKSLQGKIWRAGYEDGSLKGHIFEDVPRVLRALHERGLPVAIYSSGSVAAQQLLFGYSEAGDLTPLLCGYFDTTTGPKKVADSYTAIAAALGTTTDALLFATDSLAEAQAARAAGCKVALMARPGNPEVPAGHGFTVWATLEPLLAL